MSIDGTEQAKNALAYSIIWKAIERGWGKTLFPPGMKLVVKVHEGKCWVGEDTPDGKGMGWVLDILLQSPAFNKAYWGEHSDPLKDWKYHCRRIVYAKDTVEYMRKGLKP